MHATKYYIVHIPSSSPFKFKQRLYLHAHMEWAVGAPSEANACFCLPFVLGFFLSFPPSNFYFRNVLACIHTPYSALAAPHLPIFR
jgi:hypothetical protein